MSQLRMGAPEPVLSQSKDLDSETRDSTNPKPQDFKSEDLTRWRSKL
jgi:hypothetical protein